jgi:hypothetical protein
MQTTPRPTGNSHIAAVLVVGLESVTTQQVADGIAKSGKPVAMISEVEQLRRARFFGTHAPRDKDRERTSRKIGRESTT